MAEIFTLNNMKFLLGGLRTTLYISVVSILLSTFFGAILGVMRNSKVKILKLIAGAYIEIVRNIPNLLWIYVVFLILKLKSIQAGVFSFTLFSAAAIGEIMRGGLNSIGRGQYEAAQSQGFTTLQQLRYIILPQAIYRIIPTLVSQFITIVKDTSLLWSVVAIQELTGSATILMGRYYRIDQVFILYGLLAVVYFVFNFALSIISRKIKKHMAY